MYMKKVVESITKGEFNFWWGIGITLAAVVFAYATLTSRVNTLYNERANMHEKFKDHTSEFHMYKDATEQRFDGIDSSFAEIKVTLAQIQKDILYIRQAIGN
jgi:hypothetical protein